MEDKLKDYENRIPMLTTEVKLIGCFKIVNKFFQYFYNYKLIQFNLIID